MVLKFFRRMAVPAGLAKLLVHDETVLSIAEIEGGQLVVTRYGVWVLNANRADITLEDRIGWESISKAHWDGKSLGLTIGRVRGAVGGADWIEDQPRRIFRVLEPRKVTDIVHTRTRSAIVRSVHHDVLGGGVWVVLRKVPGKNGAIPQVRFDPGTDVTDPHLDQLVAELVRAELGR